MFDFFAEISDSVSQAVTLVNTLLSSLKDFFTTFTESGSMQTLFQTVNACPAVVSFLFALFVGVTVLDFIRGR